MYQEKDIFMLTDSIIGNVEFLKSNFHRNIINYTFKLYLVYYVD